MIEKEIQLVSELGLHARPSSLITGELSKMDLKVAEIHYKTSTAKLTSIMDLLTLSVSPKAFVLVRLDGPDEQKALTIIEKVFSIEEKMKK
jgi:phosphotransferase system HPr (HPr) family protein